MYYPTVLRQSDSHDRAEVLWSGSVALRPSAAVRTAGPDSVSGRSDSRCRRRPPTRRRTGSSASHRVGLEVQMIAAGVACTTDVSDDLARVNVAARVFEGVEMGVVEFVPRSVVSQTAFPPRLLDLNSANPASVAATGVPRGAIMSTPWWRRPPGASVAPTVDELAADRDRAADGQRGGRSLVRRGHVGRMGTDRRRNRHDRERAREGERDTAKHGEAFWHPNVTN